MSTPKRDSELEHEYDGIREYDNPTPGWWYLIFFATFLFSGWYFLYYHASSISTSVADGYQEAMSGDLKQRFAEMGELESDQETLLRLMNQPQWLLVGAQVFKSQCVSCHGQDAAGLVGPNLTDDYYKNVEKLDDLARVIAEGAANGAMPAWKTRLHPNEVVLVSAYVATLRGQNLPGTRGPEGAVQPPWPSAPKEAPSRR